MRISRLFGVAIGCATLLLPAVVVAQPARIIILRHSEKRDAYALCDMGTQRAEALVRQYLGRGAAQSLFGPDGRPDAIMAITLHPVETITPVAQSWNLPVIAYTVLPPRGEKGRTETMQQNRRTREAAQDVLTDPRYLGKIVVMAWEHDHIAKAQLEREFPGEPVTLRQLLHLDRLSGVPDTWPDAVYDYFWIVDYAPSNPVPVAFHMVRQIFTPPFEMLPANAWDEPEPRHVAMGCMR